MAEFCPRGISFTIPGVPGVQITAVENGGNIDFTVDVIDSSSLTGDLRGLFFQFNEAKLSTLQISNPDGLITDTQIKANKVIDLGNGANLNGAASPFDVGIEFGTPGIGSKGNDISFPVHFTLSDAAHNLTLDDLAHLQFGARVNSIGIPGDDRSDSEKIVALAPAAPDAKDDTATTHEDTPVQIFVLANDTDADGTSALRITEVHQDPGHHGTVTIAADGKSLTYTPDKDYAGLNTNPNSVDDSFVYCVSDGKGGEDHATANLHVIPVADQPDISMQVVAPLAGDPINEVRLHITATTVDVDGSETLSAFSLGGLPAGVTITAGNVVHSSIGLDSASEDVQLFLPTDHTTTFDFAVTATSAENGNGDPDTASNTVSKHIELDVTHNTATETFQAMNQSIWDPSLPGRFDDVRFIGLDVHGDPGINLDPVGSASGHYELKIGFQSTLHATLGDIDATLPYNITVNTLYNRTTDALFIDPSAALAPGGSFMTHGPGGSYSLDFIFHALLSAQFEILGVGPSASIGPLDLGFNILGIDSSTFTKTIPIPPFGTPYATLTLNWPQVNTTGAQSGPDTLHSDGTSPDIVNLNLDVIGLALAALGISPNPLDLGFVNLLALSVNGGIDVAQHFDLKSLGLHASLQLEDGFMLPDFTFGSPLPIIQNASSHDSNHDGNIGLSLHLTPDATLQNLTALGFNVGASLDLFHFPDPVDATLVHLGGDFPIGEIPLYHSAPFGLAFNSQDYSVIV